MTIHLSFSLRGCFNAHDDLLKGNTINVSFYDSDELLSNATATFHSDVASLSELQT